MLAYIFVFIAGVAVGVVFHASISKWGSKAKATAKEVGTDLKADLDKVKGSR